MDEKGFWSGHVKRALHQPPFRIAWKIQDHYNSGLPDVGFIQRGSAGFLELKYRPNLPKRPTSMVPLSVTTEQKARLLEGREASGHSWLLVGIDRMWYLYDPFVMRDREWTIYAHEIKNSDPIDILTGSLRDFKQLVLFLMQPAPAAPTSRAA